MNKKIIIINGHPAAGKTTFAIRLSRELNTPYLAKNTFKNAISISVPVSNQKESSRMSAITFDAILYVMERLTEAGKPFIIEGSFAPNGLRKKDEAGAIKALIDQYAYQSLTFIFKGDMKILYERFLRREEQKERGANALHYEMTFDYFREICRDLETFYIGGSKVTVDTTDFNNVNFPAHLETARIFLA